MSNPNSEIVLIGDDDSSSLAHGLGITQVPWSDYGDEAERFAGSYIHRSSHGRDFELVCLQRWLVLESWMIANNRNKVVAMDSDILVFTELESVLESVPKKGMGYVHDSAHFAWIPDVADLTAVCDVIRDAYADPEHRLIEEMHRSHLAKSDQGGVSDMSFFQYLASNGTDLVHDIRGPHGAREWNCDVTMNDGVGGFVMDGGVKKIRWIKSIPHGLRRKDDSWVPFATLHFQGAAKSLMPAFFHKMRQFNSSVVRSNDWRILRKRVYKRLCKLISKRD